MGISARLLGTEDTERVDTFLKPHTPFAYYMRSNARYGGLVFQGKPYQADFFGAFDEDELIGMLAHTWIARMQIFVTQMDAIPFLVKIWKDHLAIHPREIECFNGPSAQVRQVERAVGISSAALRGGGSEEQLYTLALEGLSFPALADQDKLSVRPARASDIDLLTAWRHDYNVEAKGEQPGKENYDRAHEEINRRVRGDDLFVLEECNVPVSFCGAGGFLPDWKAVGPVWTQPDKRAKGYGRAVTARALLHLRDGGATHAVLFTENPYAASAYRALGFKVIGDWRLDYLIERVAHW
jgi:predicted GNAT family acetyltransferase